MGCVNMPKSKSRWLVCCFAVNKRLRFYSTTATTTQAPHLKNMRCKQIQPAVTCTTKFADLRLFCQFREEKKGDGRGAVAKRSSSTYKSHTPHALSPPRPSS